MHARTAAQIVAGAGDRFELEQRLGDGATSTVFRALDREQHVQVALKIPRDQEEPHTLVALKQEFRTLATFSHPHVVAFHELFVTPTGWFFSMELVRGTDAMAHVRRAPGSARTVLLGLASGLEALHDRGIVHGDLKPGNAWIDADGRAVLLDLGLAVAQATRRAGGGAPRYRAPEVQAGARAAPAADVYALGQLALALLAEDREPDEALRALALRMISDDPAARPSSAAAREALQRETIDEPRRATFVGRRAERHVLEHACARATTHARPQLVRVNGAAGIGKTALVEAVLDRLPMATLRGRCSEHERVPFAALDQVIDALAHAVAGDATLRERVNEPLAALAEAFPVLSPWVEDAPHRPSEPTARRARLGAALARVLEALAERRGLVVWIDDAHWADADGARLLGDTLAALQGGPIVVVLSQRHAEPGGVHEPTPGPAAAIDTHTVALRGLDADDAATLAATLGVSEEGSTALVARAQGSPFLLEMLALDAAAPDGGADADTAIRRAVERRAAALPEASRALLDVLCLAGHPLPIDVARKVARADAGVVRALAAARFARSSPGARGALELAPYHDRVRETVAASVSAPQRRAIHAALADVLSTRADVDPTWTCRHLAAAGERERAARLAADAAQRAAQQLAFDRAAELFAFALSHGAAPAGSEAEVALRVALGDALANAGQGERAAEAYLAAVALAQGRDVRRDLHRKASEQYLRAGAFGEGVALLDAVLRELGLVPRTTPARALGSLVAHRAAIGAHGLAPRRAARPPEREEAQRIDACVSGAIGLSVVDSIRSADLMSEALWRTLRVDDPRRLGVVLAWHAAFLANEGGPAEAHTRAVIARAARLVGRDDDPYGRACVASAEGLLAFHLGQASVARTHLGVAGDVFSGETLGSAKEHVTVRSFALAALAIEGALDPLARGVATLERASEGRGERYALTNLRQGLMILRWLAADDPRAARADLDAAMRGLAFRGFGVQHWFDLWGRVIVALYEGDVVRARREHATERGRLLRSLLVRTQWTRAHALVLEATTALAVIRREPRAEAWARGAIRALEAERRPWTSALAAMLRGAAWCARGETMRGLDTLDASVALLDAADLGLWAAATRTTLAAAGRTAHAEAASRWAARERVVAPERLARALLPGAWRALT